MDANAYLKRHGWRGDGHSLDTTNRGIRKPLLVSKKIDVLGVGLNKHAAVSDQWWMRAFDEGLKNLGTDRKSTLSTVRTHGIHLGGLYGRFVKGETVEGTIGSGSNSEDDKVKAMGGEVLGQKRKRGEEVEDKRSKRKVEGSSEKVKKLRRDIDRKIKVVLREAVECGLISKSSSSKKASERSSAHVDEATLVHIFERAGLPASAMPEDDKTSKKSVKDAKYKRGKSQRELKRAAQVYFESQLSESDLQELRDDDQAEKKRRAAKGEEKEVEKYKRKAEKAIARAAKAERKKLKLEQGADASVAGEEKPKEQKAGKSKTRKVEKDAKEAELASIGFVVDTAGDSNLTKAAPTPARGKKSPHVIDSTGQVRYTVTQGEPVPLDPTIWDGIDIKTLPKAVREARRAWMAEKRNVRKGLEPGHVETEKTKGQRTDAERKEAARNLLHASRQALKKGSAAGIDSPIPLIKVTTTSGSFTKEEAALARTAVRRALKKEKSAAKEERKTSKKTKGPKQAAMKERYLAKKKKE